MNKTNEELIEGDSSFKFLAIEFNRLYEERNSGDIHNMKDRLYREYLERQRSRALVSDGECIESNVCHLHLRVFG